MSTGTVSAHIPGVAGGAESDLLFYNADTTLTLTQPLLRGFGRAVSRRSLTSAEVRRDDAARQQTLAEQQVTVDVAAAYYGLLSQQAFVEVAQQSLQRARRLRDASEAKLDAGLVSQLDVLRSQQLVAQAEIQLFDAQSGVEVAELRYQNGLSNNLDVVTAESGLLAAEGRRIQALADSAVARLRLRAILGVLNPRTDLGGAAPVVPIGSKLEP